MSSPQWDLLQDDERARLGEWIGETLAKLPDIPVQEWYRFSFDIVRLSSSYRVNHVRLAPIEELPRPAGAGLPTGGTRQPAPPGSVHMHLWEPIGDRCGPMVTHECLCGAAIYLPPPNAKGQLLGMIRDLAVSLEGTVPCRCVHLFTVDNPKSATGHVHGCPVDEAVRLELAKAGIV